VQGVCFRAEARDVARALGVGGWVRNEPDGSVAAAFEGDVGSVERMVDWCRRGPSDARVDSVDVTAERPVGERRFVVRA
jgi:acylphosphatase